jgi:chromosome segregation ATPase
MASQQQFDRLEAALARLAEAQERSEVRQDRVGVALERLAESEARTAERVEVLESRMDRLEATMERMVEAQVRTEVRLGELAQAQVRTEVRLGELAQAQVRTEARVEELAGAQARTEVSVRALGQQVGRLSDLIGFSLEELAREVAPAYLAQHHAIEVSQLERRFFTLDSQDVEVDLYGEGQRDDQPLTVVGEVKTSIYRQDVERAVRQAIRLAPLLPAQPVTVLFAFVIHPSAKEAAERLGAIVIPSTGRS